MSKKLSTPPEGIPLEEWAGMTRQKRYQMQRYSQGLCVGCGKEPISPSSKRLGALCLTKQRERMRSSTGASRRNLNAKGYNS